MSQTLRGICSMAPQPILQSLFDGRQIEKTSVVFEACGGVDAAKRVSQSEPFDMVVLSAKAIDTLIGNGHALAESRTDIATSSVTIAVREGSSAPDVSTAEALRQTLLDAESIGYSTGPSGVALMRQIEQWQLADALKDKLKQSAPGVPVGQLIRDGDAAIGFQQKSELMHMDGITLLGAMPPGCEIDTDFAGAVCATSSSPDAARVALQFLQSPDAATIIQDNGMTPASRNK